MEKKVKDEKNIHEGHRKRLVDLAYNAGLDKMSDVQVVELFLTYIFPRGDVNPLAHRLLDEFETLTNIASAEVSSLVKVPGINERSAKLIVLFNEMFFYFATSRMGKKCVVTTRAEMIDIVEDYLRFRNTENILLIALSAGKIVTHKKRIAKKSPTEADISMLEIADFISNSKPASMVIAHCHPYGSATPSPEDKVAYKKVEDFCNQCGVELIDSLIIGEDGVYSQAEDERVRTYFDVEALHEMF